MDVLLINCDKTYPLDSVEALLKRTYTPGSNTRIEKRYCNVSELQTVSEEVRRRRLLCGVFVVNAYESRLSINEDKAGIGYAVLYKALLEAAKGRVVVVIGGDDRYKDGEQDKSVLSTWAYHKVAAQFDDTYLDGRRGFVFSWDERHNPVHEEALECYLRAILSGKPGLEQPFKPTPRSRPLPKPEPISAPSTSTDVGKSQTPRTDPKRGPSTPRQATTLDAPQKEAPTKTEVREDKKETGPASTSQQQQHTNAHGLTSHLRTRQHDDKGTNESQRKARKDELEHKTVDSSTGFEDPLGASASYTPKVTQNIQPHSTNSNTRMPGPSRAQFDPVALCLSLLNGDEEAKLATGLKEKMEKDTRGRTVKVIQLYVDGKEKSRYDFLKDGNAYPIPAKIQRAINERKGEKGAIVIVVFVDGHFIGGVGWECIDLSDLIVKFPQQLREKIETYREGRIVKVIQIFVNGKVVSRYDYPEGADVFPIPDYIQPGISGKGLEVVVIFDDGSYKGREELASRCLNLDALIDELA
uniref:Uncharacterized protein n=1 Tax=Branchiostoma floridae TaxID=7739 RepID=C3XXP9_BRAFL|eukprot:XP_002611499.1 hypothetical protein BRAFLDRAFT_63866 [Branchiostoma floridae]